MKTAYEIAMEKLRRKDRETGEAQAPLDDDQKREIAEIRNVYEARRAEREILFQADIRKARARMDEEAIATVEENYRRDRGRLDQEMEEKIRAVRQR